MEDRATMWMDFACDLREFIEYGLKLTPVQEDEYKAILRKYGADSDYNELEEEYGIYLLG